MKVRPDERGSRFVRVSMLLNNAMTNNMRQYIDIIKLESLDEDAFHGSPHSFDEFSSSSIGTGEGAQAYGHGLYFAGKRDVAEFYRDTISYQHALRDKKWIVPDGIPEDHGKVIIDVLSRFFGYSDPEYIMKSVREDANGVNTSLDYVKQLQDRLDSLTPDLRERFPNIVKNVEDNLATAKRVLAADQRAALALPYLKKYGVDAFVPSGKLYHVEIPEDDEYLLWDAPLSAQSPKVKERLSFLMQIHNVPRKNNVGAETTGGQMYEYLTARFNGNKKITSEELLDNGIPGVKYLDSGSRGVGRGTFNYVIFDDSLVKIKNVE